MAELLTGMDIADVHLDDRSVHGTDGILQGDGRVGIGTSIENDAVMVKARNMNAVDKFTLDVGLVIVNLHVRIAATQLGQVLVELHRSVHPRLATAQ